jgi:hypothetical protein
VQVSGAHKSQLTRLSSPVDNMFHVSCVACNFIFCSFVFFNTVVELVGGRFDINRATLSSFGWCQLFLHDDIKK